MEDPYQHLFRPSDRRVRVVSLFVTVAIHAALGVGAFLYVVRPKPIERPRVAPVLTFESYRPAPPPRPTPVIEEIPDLPRPVYLPAPEQEAAEPIVEPTQLSSLTPDEHIPFTTITEPVAGPPPPPGPIHVVDGVTPPRVIPATKIEPTYPGPAQFVGAEGQVVLLVVVRKDGTVELSRVLQAPRPDLDFTESSIEAVSQWRYHPALQHGKPVDVFFTVEVNFRLD